MRVSAEASGAAGDVVEAAGQFGLAFVVYGARIGVRVNRPELLDRIEPYLPPLRRPARSSQLDCVCDVWLAERGPRGETRRHGLFVDGRLHCVADQVDELLEQLASSLEHEVAMRARRKLFVHAGVVAWNGRAIVVPGRSMDGKTSLVLALVRAGADYWSDEFAVFDARGRVHPFPRPLSVRDGHGRRSRHPPPRPEAGSYRRPLPLGVVAATRYRPDAAWRPRRLSGAEGVLALLDNTLVAQVRPRLALATLARAAVGATILQGPRGEADDAARDLLRRCEEAPVGGASGGEAAR